MKKCGVYKISNSITKDFYIGSSQNIAERWRKHRWHLNKGVHANRYLLRSWAKYGQENFEFSILEECTFNVLLERELHYISTLIPQFNISTDPSAPMTGRKHTVESRKLISESNIGKHSGKLVTDESKALLRAATIRNRNNKPVIAVDSTTGEVRHRFETIGDVADMGWKKSAVIRCCKGKMPSYQGFLWRYENPEDLGRVIRSISDETRAKLSVGRSGKTHTSETREKIAATHEWRPVASFDPKTGEVVKTYERMRAVEDDGFAQCRVWVCCQGLTKKNKAPTHGGLGWKYLT